MMVLTIWLLWGQRATMPMIRSDRISSEGVVVLPTQPWIWQSQGVLSTLQSPTWSIQLLQIRAHPKYQQANMEKEIIQLRQCLQISRKLFKTYRSRFKCLRSNCTRKKQIIIVIKHCGIKIQSMQTKHLKTCNTNWRRKRNNIIKCWLITMILRSGHRTCLRHQTKDHLSTWMMIKYKQRSRNKQKFWLRHLTLNEMVRTNSH